MAEETTTPPALEDPRTISVLGKDITFEAVAPGSYEEILLYLCALVYFPYVILGAIPYLIKSYQDLAISWTIEWPNYIITSLV